MSALDASLSQEMFHRGDEAAVDVCQFPQHSVTSHFARLLAVDVMAGGVLIASTGVGFLFAWYECGPPVGLSLSPGSVVPSVLLLLSLTVSSTAFFTGREGLIPDALSAACGVAASIVALTQPHAAPGGVSALIAAALALSYPAMRRKSSLAPLLFPLMLTFTWGAWGLWWTAEWVDRPTHTLTVHLLNLKLVDPSAEVEYWMYAQIVFGLCLVFLRIPTKYLQLKHGAVVAFITFTLATMLLRTPTSSCPILLPGWYVVALPRLFLAAYYTREMLLPTPHPKDDVEDDDAIPLTPVLS